VLPASRREDRIFRDWVVTNRPDWVEIARRPTRDLEHPEDVISAYPDHLPSADGHRIIWIHSTAKALRRRQPSPPGHRQSHRGDRCAQCRLASPRCRIKTAVAAETEAREHLAELNATRWIDIHVETDTIESFRQAKRGRPGPNTAFKKVSRTRLRIRFAVDEHQVAHDAASDGMWPLITNDRNLPPAEAFAPSQPGNGGHSQVSISWRLTPAPLRMRMGRAVPLTSYVCSALQPVSQHEAGAC
jgi:hypothetical protein